MMKIINAHSALSEPMTEDETKNFMANDNDNLLMHIGTIDNKGQPNVAVTAFYLDEPSEKIYLTTYKTSKKESVAVLSILLLHHDIKICHSRSSKYLN